jgi:hypothetical protein
LSMVRCEPVCSATVGVLVTSVGTGATQSAAPLITLTFCVLVGDERLETVSGAGEAWFCVAGEIPPPRSSILHSNPGEVLVRGVVVFGAQGETRCPAIATCALRNWGAVPLG